MPVVSKPAFSLKRKRLAGALIVFSLSLLIAACSDDDKPEHSNAANSTASASFTSNSSAQDNPLAVAPAPAAAIQTPALPVSGAIAGLPDAASASLAPPVIHTVD